MWLLMPESIQQIVWEGLLEPTNDEVVERSQHQWASQGLQVSMQQAVRTMPVVSIGQPETWPLQEVYPLKQMPRLLRTKMAQADFYLVRLSCSFRPIYKESRIQWARFRFSLLPNVLGQFPIANDLYPLQVFQEVKHQTKVTLSPTLKFQEMEVGVGGVEFGVEYRELQPRISAAGAGEAEASWDYVEARGAAVEGCKWMYVLVKASKGMSKGQAIIDLVADVEVQGVRVPVVAFRHRKQAEAHLTVQLW